MDLSTAFLRTFAIFLLLCAASSLPAQAQATASEPASAGQVNEEVPTGPRNMLHPDTCEIIAAPSDRPAKLLEGGFDLPSDELSQAIYAFTAEKGTSISGVRIFINGRADQAIKSVELFAADSADGPFVPVAKAGDTKNLKLFKSKGWQEFSFPAVTVKYFKLGLLAHNHAWVRVENDGLVNGLQLIGEPLP
jgi:hypothetical protein